MLFDRHYPRVVRYCHGILRSPEEAEDAAQQTFLTAYCELPRLDEPLALRAWLYTVARHRCLTTLRTRRERPLEDAREPARDHVLGDLATRDDLRALLADVACLPEDQRTALVLTQLGDLPHADIAATLGCSPAKVKALVFQARTALAHGREARDTSCAEIREQISAAHGAALRRAVLRRHLSDCAGCRAFRDATRAERRTLGACLPLAPLAWLRNGLLAVLGPGAAGGGAALGGTGLAADALATVAIPVAVAAQRTGREEDGARPRVTLIARQAIREAPVRGGGAVVGGTAASTRHAIVRVEHRAARTQPATAPRPPAAVPPAAAGPGPDARQARPAAKTRPQGAAHTATGAPAPPGHGRPAGKEPARGAGHGRPAGKSARTRCRPWAPRPGEHPHESPATAARPPGKHPHVAPATDARRARCRRSARARSRRSPNPAALPRRSPRRRALRPRRRRPPATRGRSRPGPCIPTGSPAPGPHAASPPDPHPAA